MTGPRVTLEEAEAEVAGFALGLVGSRYDAITKKAIFAKYLHELEKRCPEVAHVDAELGRLAREAASLGSDVEPQVALRFVRDLAALLEPVQKLAAFADTIAEAAANLVEGVSP